MEEIVVELLGLEMDDVVNDCIREKICIFIP